MSFVINGNGATIDACGHDVGIFHIKSSNVIINNITFINAKKHAVIVDGGCDDCVINNSQFYNNTAIGTDGGAVYWEGDNGRILSSDFANNSADLDGGAVYWLGENGKLDDYCTFLDNEAHEDGGAIYWKGNYGKITSCNFARNRADEKAGVYNNTVNVTSKGVENRTATSENTAVYNPGLNITKVANATAIKVGDKAVFIINVTNNGGRKLVNINVTDSLNTNLVYGSYAVIEGDWNMVTQGNLVYLAPNDLDVGKSASIILFFNTTVSGTFENNVTVMAEGKEYGNATANVAVEKIPTHISVENVTAYPDSDVNISINVTADDGLPFTGNVTITFPDGKNQTAEIINGTGNATWHVPASYTKGVYDDSIKFPEDNKYLPSTGNGTITVKVDSSTVKAENVSVTYGEDITVPVTSVNATGIIYQIIDENGKTVAEGTLRPGENITGLDLAAGKYTVKLTNEVDPQHTSATNTSTITVNQAYSSVKGEDVSVIYGNSVEVAVTSVNATEITYQIIDKDGNVVVNGTLKPGESISGLDLAAGEYKVNLTNVVDANHISATNTSTITVNPASSTVKGKDVTVYVGEAIEVPVTSVNATGVIYQIIDSTGKVVRDGVLKPGEGIDAYGLAAGKYEVKLTNAVDANHISATNTSTIVVKKLPSTVVPKGKDIYVGQTEVISIKVGLYDATGTVTVSVAGNTYYKVPVVDGKAHVTVPGLKAGSYTVNVTYSGDDKYLPSKNATAFEVKKILPPIKVDDSTIAVGRDGVITVTLPVDVTGTVTVSVACNTYYKVPVVDGKAHMTVPGFKEGSYIVKVAYSGDDKYLPSKNAATFVVKKILPPVKVDAPTITVGRDGVITVILPVDATGTVTVSVAGNTYYDVPVVDGKAYITVPGFKEGSYIVKVAYSGDDKYLPGKNATAFVVKKILPPVKVDAPTITVGRDGVITVILPVDATGTVTIAVEGKTYTAPVKNGKAVFIVSGLKAGLHDIKAFYSGDDKYLPNNNTGTIKVLYKEDKNETSHKKVHEHVKSGLERYETGNPIFILLMVLSLFGVSIKRRK